MKKVSLRQAIEDISDAIAVLDEYTIKDLYKKYVNPNTKDSLHKVYTFSVNKSSKTKTYILIKE